MTRHLASTRSFYPQYGPLHPHVFVTPAFPARPCSGGALVMSPLPVGLAGQPYLGMDPSAPATWVRPYNPQGGMIAQLNFDGAKYQGDTPMGGTWHYPRPVRDRKLRRRRLWRIVTFGTSWPSAGCYSWPSVYKLGICGSMTTC